MLSWYNFFSSFQIDEDMIGLYSVEMGFLFHFFMRKLKILFHK